MEVHRLRKVLGEGGRGKHQSKNIRNRGADSFLRNVDMVCCTVWSFVYWPLSRHSMQLLDVRIQRFDYVEKLCELSSQ